MNDKVLDSESFDCDWRPVRFWEDEIRLEDAFYGVAGDLRCDSSAVNHVAFCVPAPSIVCT